MLERIQVGDAQAVRDQAARRAAAPRPDHDRVLAREVVEVPDDEEVGRIAGLPDDHELVLGALLDRRAGLAVPPSHAVLDQPPQVLVRRQAVRHVEGRQQGFAELDLEVDHVRDVEGAGQRVGQIRERRGHLLGRLQIVLLRRETPAVGIVEARARLQAQQDVVCLRVVAVNVVQVVGGAQPQPEVLAQRGQRGVDLLLLVDAVALDLEQESVLAEDVAVGRDRLLGSLEVVVRDPARDLSLEAARQRNQPFRVLGQDLLVDARLVVHALHLPDGAEAHEVDVALVIGRQQREVARVAVDAALAQQPRPGGDVDLAADDRLDPGFLACLVEVDRAVHDAVIGERDRGHLELGRPRDHGVDATGPIEQRVLGVVVEVNEGLWGVRHRLDLGWREPRG